MTVSILEIAQTSEVKNNIIALVLNVLKKPLVLVPIIGTCLFTVKSLPADTGNGVVTLIGGTNSGLCLP
jgi:hypothetical protein